MEKIRFDINKKPEIISGKYSVVTRDNNPVRIFQPDIRCSAGNTDTDPVPAQHKTDDRCGSGDTSQCHVRHPCHVLYGRYNEHHFTVRSCSGHRHAGG